VGTAESAAVRHACVGILYGLLQVAA
jgi:hypothetical protein